MRETVIAPSIIETIDAAAKMTEEKLGMNKAQTMTIEARVAIDDWMVTDEVERIISKMVESKTNTLILKDG